MGIGIIVCGLNGSGKSTLGKALSDKLGFHFIDKFGVYWHFQVPKDRNASYVPKDFAM